MSPRFVANCSPGTYKGISLSATDLFVQSSFVKLLAYKVYRRFQKPLTAANFIGIMSTRYLRYLVLMLQAA